MNCQETQRFLHAYGDGELELAKSLELEQHLQACPPCSRAYSHQQTIQTAVRRDALYFRAPHRLRRSVTAAVRRAARAEAPARHRSWSWLTVGLTATAAALVALLLVSNFARPSAQDRLLAEITASHVRSLMVSHLTDVASTDQHTVKPWFDGKLDFAPPVKDLAERGFPLTGGRLDYLGGRPVAALVYQRHQHIINLFTWPSSQGAADPRATRKRHGYNLVGWVSGEMTFWAVSDLNETELQEFAQSFRAN